MNTTDATLTNARYELPAHARGVLVLADPPEAGWRLELPPDEGSHHEAEQWFDSTLAHEQRACDLALKRY